MNTIGGNLLIICFDFLIRLSFLDEKSTSFMDPLSSETFWVPSRISSVERWECKFIFQELASNFIYFRLLTYFIVGNIRLTYSSTKTVRCVMTIVPLERKTLARAAFFIVNVSVWIASPSKRPPTMSALLDASIMTLFLRHRNWRRCGYWIWTATTKLRII